jgi:hypothetical protein
MTDLTSPGVSRPAMSLEEKLDPSSAAGELVFHVFGASRIWRIHRPWL